MKKTKHCQLCENSKHNIQKGAFCGLTDLKPDFSRKCDKIDLGTNLYARFTDITLEHQLNEDGKGMSFIVALGMLTVSLLVISCGIWFWNIIYEKGFIASAPIVIIVIGIGLLPLVGGVIKRYIGKRNRSLSQLKEIEKVLEIYGYRIECNLTIKSGLHNIKSVKSMIILYRNGKSVDRWQHEFEHIESEERSQNDIAGIIPNNKTKNTWHGNSDNGFL